MRQRQADRLHWLDSLWRKRQPAMRDVRAPRLLLMEVVAPHSIFFAVAIVAPNGTSLRKNGDAENPAEQT